MKSWQPVTLISGVTSMHLFHYNNQHYFFFGDLHFGREESCTRKGYKCDYFNYTFTKTYTYGTNCTQMGTLLHDWFIYNNHHFITTDFFLEAQYNDINDQYTDIITKRRELQLTKSSESPFAQKSWLQLLPYIMDPCFNAQSCPYSPNVKLHKVDIRLMSQETVNPFLIYYDIIQYIDNIKINNIIQMLKLRNDILSLYDLILIHYKLIIHAMFSPQGFDDFILIMAQKADILSDDMKRIYFHMLLNLEDLSIHHMYIIAYAYQKLHEQNPVLADIIINYMHLKIDMLMKNVLKKYVKDTQNITNKKTMDSQVIYDDMMVILNDYFKNYLNTLAQYTMDTYTLIKIFSSFHSDEVIVYAGSDHIDVYVQFFKYVLNLNPLIDIYNEDGNRCLEVPDLPLYLDVNKFRKNEA